MATPIANLIIETEQTHKLSHIDLLLIGDESREMIDRYLDRSTLFVGKIEGRPVAVCAAIHLSDTLIEIKNLAVTPQLRRQGIGRKMLQHVEQTYPASTIELGTGETPTTLRFYQSCGYLYSHRIAGFFTDNYPNPIIEEGVTLTDMIYLRKEPADKQQ